jgi:hypothetical protein
VSEPQAPDPALLQAVNTAQTPAEYMQAAQAAGLTADAEAAAAEGAAPVTPPDYGAMLAQFQADQQAQLAKIRSDFEAQLAALQAGIPAPSVDPVVSAARNLSAGIQVLTDSYPNAGRRDPLVKSNGELVAAVAEDPEGAAVEAPSPDLLRQVIARFRRFAASNPQLETGLIEHAAQLAEDTAELV